MKKKGSVIVLEKLKKDMVEAMKNQEKERLMVIRMVKAAMQQEHIDHKRELDDDLLIDVINKQIKMRMDAICEFEKANRLDLVEKNKRELEILKQYLPEQLSQEEIIQIIDEAFDTLQPTGKKDMGKVMMEVTPKLKGRANMREVSTMINERLN